MKVLECIEYSSMVAGIGITLLHFIVNSLFIFNSYLMYFAFVDFSLWQDNSKPWSIVTCRS